MDISQTVTGLTAGQVLQLQFDHANRTTGASGNFEVYWNNALVATINGTGTAMRNRMLSTSPRSPAPTRFVSRALGTVDGAGASLDNVRLFALQSGARPGGSGQHRPLVDPFDDVWAWNIYDAAHRLVQTIDGAGAATCLQYDGASRLISTRSYANRVSAANLTTLKARASNPNLMGEPGQWRTLDGRQSQHNSCWHDRWRECVQLLGGVRRNLERDDRRRPERGRGRHGFGHAVGLGCRQHQHGGTRILRHHHRLGAEPGRHCDGAVGPGYGHAACGRAFLHLGPQHLSGHPLPLRTFTQADVQLPISTSRPRTSRTLRPAIR